MKGFTVFLSLGLLLLSGCHNNRLLAHNFVSQHKVVTADALYAASKAEEAKKPAMGQKRADMPQAREEKADAPASKPAVSKAKTLRVDSRNVKQALLAQYQAWKHVRYQLGGLSRRGIDCSGFTQKTFADRFDITLPRDTRSQAKSGKAVSRKHLRPGDLVFFKIGHGTRHVGIYLDDGRFLHASTSKGVIISRLDEAYWAKHYWKAVRVTFVR